MLTQKFAAIQTSGVERSAAALVQGCLRGEQGAWDALVDRYVRLVYSVGVRHGLQPAEVEDMAQETFAALAVALPSLDDAEALPAWLMTTARRLCWRLVQKRRREGVGEAGDLNDAEPGTGATPLFSTMPSMDEMSAEWGRQEALAAGLKRLGDKCRVLITLLYLEQAEPSYDEISARAGIPRGSIGPTRTRCLQQLRSILEGLGFDGA